MHPTPRTLHCTYTPLYHFAAITISNSNHTITTPPKSQHKLRFNVRDEIVLGARCTNRHAWSSKLSLRGLISTHTFDTLCSVCRMPSIVSTTEKEDRSKNRVREVVAVENISELCFNYFEP